MLRAILRFHVLFESETSQICFLLFHRPYSAVPLQEWSLETFKVVAKWVLLVKQERSQEAEGIFKGVILMIG